mgnify:CR=1 FL=1
MASFFSGGKGQANQPPAMKTEAVVAGGSGNDALKNAAAAGVGAALASHLVRGGASAGSSGRNLTANEIHGAMVDAGDEIADQTGDAVQQAVLSANNATGKGVDPILLVKLFLAHYKWKAPIIITVSPSLNVLTGNVLKQIYDQSGGGNNLTPLVWSQVSDLTPSDDPKDLALSP